MLGPKPNGRPRLFDAAKCAHARDLYLQGHSVERILRELEISRPTFYRYRDAWHVPMLRVGILDGLRLSVQRYNAFPNGAQPSNLDLQVMKLLGSCMQQKIHFTPLSLPRLFDALDNDVVDFAIGQLGSSPQRAARFRFSAPYCNLADAPNMALVAGRAAAISPNALSDARIATVADSLCGEWLTHAGVNETKIRHFGLPDGAMQALVSNKVEATVLSYPCQVSFVAKHAAFEIKSPLVSFGGRQACLLFGRENDGMHDRVSSTLAGLVRSHAVEALEERILNGGRSSRASWRPIRANASR
jgi:ABC-type amino acid transport substrate-binding protein